MTTNLNTLGKTLARNAAKMRQESALTLTQLSEFSGVSRYTLRRLEDAKQNRRSYNPMFKTVVKLAGLAGVTVDEFTKSNLTFS